MRYRVLIAAAGLAAAACGGGGGLPDSVDSLSEALAALGATVEEAPAEAVQQGAAVFCGAEDVRPLEAGGNQPIGDPQGRRCFIDAVETGAEAVFVRSQPTVEGDPVVEVFRTGGSQVTLYIDTTRDKFGSGRWEAVPCRGLAFRTDVAADFFTCG